MIQEAYNGGYDWANHGGEQSDNPYPMSNHLDYRSWLQGYWDAREGYANHFNK